MIETSPIIKPPVAPSKAAAFVFEPTRKTWLRRLTANGQYYLWFKHKQKRHQFKLNTDNYAIAVARGEDEIRKIIAQQDTQIVADGKATLGLLLENFLRAVSRQVESRELKRTSYDAIEDGARKLRRERAEWMVQPAAKITLKEMEDYVHRLRTTQSPTTVNKVVDILRRAYALGIEERVIIQNPAAGLRRAKLRAVKSDEIPTEEQYQELLAEIRRSKLSHKWHVIDLVEFLSNFGCRIKEARNILRSHVDLDAMTIKIVGDPDPNIRTKNGHVRFVPVFEHTLPLIRRLLDRPALHIYGKEVRSESLLGIGKCYGAINSAARKLGIPVHGHHVFRHLCATRWIEHGVNIKHVAKWLGHRDGGKLALEVYTKARDSQDKTEAIKVTGTLVPSRPLTAPSRPTRSRVAQPSESEPSLSADAPSAAVHPAKSA